MKCKWLMRMIALTFLGVLWVAPNALGDSYTFDQAESNNVYDCVDFENEMPDDVASVFREAMREGDRILSGSKVTVRSRVREIIDKESILMAVERENSIILMCAYREGGEWETCLETDSFILPGTAFRITFLPKESGEDWGIDANHAIVCEDEIWRVRVLPGCWAELVSLERRDSDGTRTFIQTTFEVLQVFTIEDGRRREEWDGLCSLPSRLSAWSMDDVPRGIEQAQRYAEEHQPVLGENQAYMSANLRERPTGKSRSLGEYSARVDVLGSQQGLNEPWYHVRVGDTEGWVTTSYLIDGSRRDIRYYAIGAATRPFACAEREVELRKSPDGETFARLLPGATMYVIVQNDGWLHVIVPQDGVITAKVNWDGIYGYVREDEVVMGDTLTELKWK